MPYQFIIYSKSKVEQKEMVQIKFHEFSIFLINSKQSKETAPSFVIY